MLTKGQISSQSSLFYQKSTPLWVPTVDSKHCFFRRLDYETSCVINRRGKGGGAINPQGATA